MDKTTVSRATSGPPCSLAQLGGELSAVINQVRRAFGPLPMAAVAARPEIARAEQVVAQTACEVQQGQADLSVWRGALEEYERVWLTLLAELRRAAKGRRAA